jgi:hypothetical protein
LNSDVINTDGKEQEGKILGKEKFYFKALFDMGRNKTKTFLIVG